MAVPGQWWIPDGTPTTQESYTPLLPINVEPYLLPDGIVGVSYNFNINFPEPQDPPFLGIASVFVFKGSTGFLPPDFGGLGNYLSGFGAPVPALPSPPAWGGNFIQIAGVPTTPGVYLNYVQITAVQQILPNPPAIVTFSERLFQITILPATSKKKNRRIGAPPIVCCDPKQFPNGCPDTLRTTNGNFYQKIGENCYILIRRRK